jgi:hypothetical protein
MSDSGSQTQTLAAGIRGGLMLHDRHAQSVVEYIVILAILISLVGGALWQIFVTLQAKFNNVNTEIGS